jgi:hypothetical protein
MRITWGDEVFVVCVFIGAYAVGLISGVYHERAVGKRATPTLEQIRAADPGCLIRFQRDKGLVTAEVRSAAQNGGFQVVICHCDSEEGRAER